MNNNGDTSRKGARGDNALPAPIGFLPNSEFPESLQTWAQAQSGHSWEGRWKFCDLVWDRTWLQKQKANRNRTISTRCVAGGMSPYTFLSCSFGVRTSLARPVKFFAAFVPWVTRSPGCTMLFCPKHATLRVFRTPVVTNLCMRLPALPERWR